jgi:predicted anti-sigma-YlaC factor YlaD
LSTVPTCRDMSELVTEYLERTVSLRSRLDMWWHLFRCEACRHYYEQVRQTVRLLGRGSPKPPESGIEEGVLAAARGDRHRES